MLEMVEPKVTLLNGTEVAEALAEIGRFAGICYDARDGSIKLLLCTSCITSTPRRTGT